LTIGDRFISPLTTLFTPSTLTLLAIFNFGQYYHFSPTSHSSSKHFHTSHCCFIIEFELSVLLFYPTPLLSLLSQVILHHHHSALLLYINLEHWSHFLLNQQPKPSTKIILRSRYWNRRTRLKTRMSFRYAIGAHCYAAQETDKQTETLSPVVLPPSESVEAHMLPCLLYQRLCSATLLHTSRLL
jgi:hypothetical protein